jgi:hypothetical protein
MLLSLESIDEGLKRFIFVLVHLEEPVPSLLEVVASHCKIDWIPDFGVDLTLLTATPIILQKLEDLEWPLPSKSARISAQSWTTGAHFRDVRVIGANWRRSWRPRFRRPGRAPLDTGACQRVGCASEELEAAGSRDSFQLERRPSTLGLDHACACIANGKNPSRSVGGLLNRRLLQRD